MEKERESRKIPQWIWHRGGEKEPAIVLSRTFRLAEPAANAEFRLALTGAAEVELDGAVVGRLDESAANVCAFRRVAAFPKTLEAGEHTLRLRIECRAFMPVAPISIHLHNRTAGCIAYLEAEGFWLATDAEWSAGEELAAVVCLLGEEPFGDLESGPDWFIVGGFGDIRATPLSGVSVIAAGGSYVQWSGSTLRIGGTGRGTIELSEPERRGLHLFYHVRKQTEWRQMNEALRASELSDLPVCTMDLGRAYNARFRLRNRADAPVTVVWNGAESLPELEHYAGLITEFVRLEAGEAHVTLPQGLRYFRLYALADEGSSFDLEWQADEVGVPLKQAGTLRTDSELLRDIYGISVHTNRICHQIGLWDGIKRDRLNWTYDFYMAAKADYALWDDLAVLRRSIEELGRGTPEGYWMNDIPAYTLWWLNNIWEYFWHTGDKAFVLSLQSEIARHCRQVESHFDPSSGELRNVERSLIEWVPMDMEETRVNMQALFRLTGDNLRKLGRLVPELACIPGWSFPSLDASAFLHGEQLITPLLGMMAGYVGEEDAKAFLASYRVQDPITPLSAYWLADCCSRYGLPDKAWEAISLVWGKMLREGATTCWESVTLAHDRDFHDSLTTYTAYDSYRISLCHSWASTPVHWLVSRVLGVTPAEPGYRSVAFRPQPIAGIATCVGTIPTPNGPITAGWDRERPGEFILELPEGVRPKG
ncbi:alpha-L-rhamnosidase C-terminal domain-containing protein [Cohnella zeiphila]|uniref:Alpha-L-rhamnosidase n=1 Tax=Cohnella zeiphila TaxID=2761120 RepID=A0A7X0SKI0_9BACL|nr:alpha-L-rhamnosidase C-terminal domain-containing protein [Cohnella zeiphila]MBB6731672.1 alpha-L-rhamnosidase [Cohnella zeiphila]